VRIDPRVELLQAYTGMSDRMVRAAMADGARGLAIVAFGRGNVPPTLVPAIAEIVAGGAIVTVSSRSIAGRVKPRYGYDGGGLQLQRAGAILAADLSAASARLLQMVALGFTPDLAKAKELIQLTCE
jgi:L-asparaginase